MKSTIVGDKYIVGEKITSTRFSEIYKGSTAVTGEQFAIKFEAQGTRMPQLSYECKLYRHLSGGLGIPKMHWFGTEGGYNIMVMDLLEESLENLMHFNNAKFFSLKTSIMLVDQIICRLEYLHNKDYIHRDVKPDNFLMGRNPDDKQIYMIDFGLVKRYRDAATHKHIPLQDCRGLTGTVRYASANSHNGLAQSRRDDLESAGYVMIYFLTGCLPWQGLKIESRNQKFRAIADLKMTLPVEELCKDCPPEVAQYIRYVKALAFDAKPDYFFLRKLLRSVFVRGGFKLDYRYDWALPEGLEVIRMMQHNTSHTEDACLPYHGDDTDVAFDVLNGLSGMQRCVFLRLFRVIALHSRMDVKMRDRNIRSVLGMCEEYGKWKAHSFFVNTRLRASRVPASLKHSLKQTAPGVPCIFGRGSVILNYAIATGVYRWTVKVNYGESEFASLSMGAGPSHLIHPAVALDEYEPLEACYLCCEKSSTKLCGLGETIVLLGETPVPDGAVISLELECEALKMSFFIDGKKVPCIVSGILPPLILAASGNKCHSFTSLSFRRIGSPTPSPVVCKVYDLEPSPVIPPL